MSSTTNFLQLIRMCDDSHLDGNLPDWYEFDAAPHLEQIRSAQTFIRDNDAHLVSFGPIAMRGAFYQTQKTQYHGNIKRKLNFAEDTDFFDLFWSTLYLKVEESEAWLSWVDEDGIEILKAKV